MTRRAKGTTPRRLRWGAALALVGACARPFEPLRHQVPSRVDPDLSSETLEQEVDSWSFEASWLTPDELYVIAEKDGVHPYYLRNEFWIRFRAPEPPEVWMSSTVYSHETEYVTPHDDLQGEVVFNTADATPDPNLPQPLVVSYRTGGMCAGSIVRRDGAVVLDLREVPGPPAEERRGR